MKKIFYLIMVLVAFSCVKEDRENTLIAQEERIDAYIKSLTDMRVVRDGGSNRVVVKEGGGKDSLAVGDSLAFYYAGYIFNNGKGSLFVTNKKEVAEENNFEVDREGAYSEILSDKKLIKGLVNGLKGAKAGENCYVIFSAKYGFNNTRVYNIPNLSPLFFEIWIESIGKN